ncbi:helix-turn-helix transcriptional regulator [Rossellomorea oryzaecorticis]|uniref:Helix-turn-helix transcriptional regulator n=1 Tax=Rossellomorea oryzaecorticis TaxID=1396505 RepID=A0ABU9KAE3_9BACI
MPFTYDPLWKLLIDKKMSKEALREKIKTSSTTIAKMGRGDNVSLDVIDRICKELDCNIEDVLKHVKK